MKEKLWPIPKFKVGDEPHVLFVITPPCSGSTILSEVLKTGHRTMTLHRTGEGHWLIPGLRAADRWKPDKKVNYASVKAAWLSQYQKVNRLVGNVDVVIEKSPPNMVRIKELAALFRNHSFLANNRNPYANCSSILHRKRDIESLGTEERMQIIGRLGETWLQRSNIIRNIVNELSIPLVTYEEFCRQPSLILQKTELPDGVTDTMHPDAEFRIKDYPIQKISDQNDRQIGYLREEEIDILNSIFQQKNELLSFFGYVSLDQ